MEKIVAKGIFAIALFVSLVGVSVAAEKLIVPGSGNPEYVLGELAKAFNARQGQYHVVIPTSSGMAGAVRDVSEGVSALGRVGRPLREGELAKGLVYLPLGREAVTAVGGAAVTVGNITKAQVKAMFAGELTDWSALGGKRAPVRVIGKEQSDAIRSQLTAYFKGMTYADTVKVVHLDPHLIELLDRYPTSFSIINRSALGNCKTKVVPLALDGVEPSAENVRNGKYPLTMEFGLIHKVGELSPASKAFVDFIRSPDGARLLQENGAVPIVVDKS